MHVLVIGSGGREHALCWKLAQSPLLSSLFCAPGNPGIAACAQCVSLDLDDHDAVTDFCRAQAIDLVVVGPEKPLVDGLADHLGARGIRVFGPTAAAAQLEGSKSFTKELCMAHDIPTAAYRRFDDFALAAADIATRDLPIIVKADGLAAGKGVVVAQSREEALEAARTRLDVPGASIIIEDYLDGEEASFFVLADGRHILALGSAQDHKRVGEGDIGPNTGGMGAYTPAPVMTADMTDRVMREIIRPTVNAMADSGTPFRGILFAGLMITGDGPKLIEYNVRFGDPECQALMPLLDSDLLALMLAACDGRLEGETVTFRPGCALTVVLAARGYPGVPQKGGHISGLAAAAESGARIFHAGTGLDSSGALIATGGRVLNVTGLGQTVADAADAAYAAVDYIDWPDGFCRRDIGWRAIARERGAGEKKKA